MHIAALGAVILVALVAQIAIAGDRPASGTVTLSKAELKRLIDQRIEDRAATTAKKKRKKVKRGPAGPQGPPGPPLHCAANTIAVGPGLCLDSTALPTGTYSAALSGCAARGERLPSISELQLAWSRGQLTQAPSVGRYWSDVGYSPASGGGSVSLATLFATASGTVEPLTASSTVPAAVCASSPTSG